MQDSESGDRLELRWFITAQGVAIQVRVQDPSGRHAALARALSDLVGQWKFPAPGDGRPVRVTYVITLAPPPAEEKSQ